MTRAWTRTRSPSLDPRAALVATVLSVFTPGCEHRGETTAPASELSRDGQGAVLPPGEGAEPTTEGSTEGASPGEVVPAEGVETPASADLAPQPAAPAEAPGEPAPSPSEPPRDPSRQASGDRSTPAPLPKILHGETNATCGKGAGTGQSLRDFDLPLIGGDGKRLTKRSLRGKVTLVNLWGTWCEPCKKELPEFARLYRHYRAHGLSFVAIATDEDPAPVISFAKSRKLAGRLAYDGEAYSKTFGERSFPFTFVVDRAGVIVAAYDGYKESCLGQLEADVRSALQAAR